MNDKLELLNALQAELEGLGIRISRIGIYSQRHFNDGEMDEVDVHELTMPCQSGYYHIEAVQVSKNEYQITVIREIQAQVRGIESRLRERILSATARQLDGQTVKRLFVEAVTKFSTPVMQDFAMVCANWPVSTASIGLDAAE